jgi:hypothetical protein
VPLVVGDGAAHALEVSVEDPHEDRGIDALGHRREADEVGEQDRDLLALALRRDAARDDLLDHRVRREA